MTLLASLKAFLWDLSQAGWQRLRAFGLVLALGLAVAAGLLVLFAQLADEVMEKETEQLDAAVLHALQQVQSPVLDQAALVASMLGAEVLAVGLVLLFAVLVGRREWAPAIGLIFVAVGAQLLNNVLKGLFQRTRPAPTTGILPGEAFAVQVFSFPSGHAMVASACYSYVAYLAWRRWHGLLRVVVVVVCAAVIFLVGLSRMYLGVHYFTDVVAGVLVGLLWAEAVMLAEQILERRRSSAPVG